MASVEQNFVNYSVKNCQNRFLAKKKILKELLFVSKLIEIAMLKQIQIVVNKTSILASRGTKEVFKTVYRISSYQIYLMF